MFPLNTKKMILVLGFFGFVHVLFFVVFFYFGFGFVIGFSFGFGYVFFCFFLVKSSLMKLEFK